MKLMLGTVQFGMSYGAFNAFGRTQIAEARSILDRAYAAGIRMLDTARAYGEAEAVLASVEAPEKFEIITKCPALAATKDPGAALQMHFEASCEALGVSNLYGYLLHDAEDLELPGVWDSLRSLRNLGRVKRVGISGYDAHSAIELCSRFPLTLVQLPGNVLDPWYQSVQFPVGVEVHLRSVFLQGFLLSAPEALPEYLAPWRGILEQFRYEAADQGLTPLEASLGPLFANQHIEKIVVGTNSVEQLEEILQAVRKIDAASAPVLGPFRGVTRDLTDPRRWRIKG